MQDASTINGNDVLEINSAFIFRWEASQNAYVIMYPEGIVKLNQTAGEILNLCNGDNDVNAIIETLAGMFSADKELIQEKTYEFLETSYAKGWIRFTS